ncbi:unnamed protein product [Fraxinus pennsylvanica]|uniref:Uncharacterized protein n=1 Tax=Fraxinus pennsylvanica TaxID=56036 RepID=A0AAD2DRU7_9LAMI|nr:unnamed protein product [Fraxinus pennsylvanica]
MSKFESYLVDNWVVVVVDLRWRCCGVMEVESSKVALALGRCCFSKNPKIITSRRPPLLSSEKDACNGVSNNPRRPKSRIVSSRYMSPSTSTSTLHASSVFSSSGGYPSPLVSRNLILVSKIPFYVLGGNYSVSRW